MGDVIKKLIQFNINNNGINDVIPIISNKVKLKYDISSNLIKFYWNVYKRKGPLYSSINFLPINYF